MNKSENPIEAVYKFPLGDAHTSAVCEFSAVIEGEKIVGVCMEKEEAQAVYEGTCNFRFRLRRRPFFKHF